MDINFIPCDSCKHGHICNFIDKMRLMLPEKEIAQIPGPKLTVETIEIKLKCEDYGSDKCA